MIYLIDANACIGWMRNKEPKIVSRIERELSANIVLCSVVVGELLYGVERLASPAYRANNLTRLKKLRQQFVSLPFDDDAAQEYAKVRAHLTGIGQLIGPNDQLIASIALANGLILVTHNVSEFSRIPGLLLEDRQ